MIHFCRSCGNLTYGDEPRDCEKCILWLTRVVVPFHVRRRRERRKAAPSCAA